MVEDELCHEVGVTRRLRIELEAHKSKSLALDQANMRVGLESLSWILCNLVVSRSITGVHKLDGLIN